MAGKTIVQEALNKVVQGQHLTRNEAREVMTEIMDGKATSAQIAALVTALRMKGETIDEIAGFAETMRNKARRVQTDSSNLLDTCGTGGDGAGTFNISTASAIVAAAGGVRVAKHGNRAASSKSGSADVLEALGINIHMDEEMAGICLEQTGMCFVFAQVFHQSMKYVAGPRKEIAIRNVFNLLGPLTNPAGADRQLLGVYDREKTELIAHVLKELGTKRAVVVSSYDGLDEISICAPTKVTELKDGQIRTYEITPDMLGLNEHSLASIQGGDAKRNAEIILSVFRGERGAHRDVVLANAGACFYVAGRCETLQEGVKLAEESIDSGKAMEKLNELIQFKGEKSHVS